MVSDRRVDLKVIKGSGPGAHPPGERPTWARRPGPAAGADEPGLRPADLMVVGYLLLTGVLILAYPKNLPLWALHVALRLVAIFLLLRFAGARIRHPVLRLMRDWYPIMAFVPLYAELNTLTNLFTTTRHDGWIVAWEATLFGGQPSQTMRLAWPQPWVSEYLHFAYFFYYFVPATLALWLSVTRDRARFSEALSAIVLVFLSCCMIFILFPVVGPYHHFGHPPASWWPGFFGPLVHSIVDHGSSLGTAFPTSHTAVAVCVWLTAWRLCRPAFWLLTGIVPALAVGTVYGGFHYAVDTIAGVLLGAVCAIAAPRLHEGLLVRMGSKSAQEPRPTFASQGRGRPLE